MIRVLATLCTLLVFLTMPLLQAEGANSGKITVFINGLKNSNGVARIALFNSEGSYADNKSGPDSAGKAFRKVAAPISANAATCTFEDIPYGEYAVRFFHDEDNSGEFKTGMFGIPKVEYGFSNNAVGKFGPAPYSKAKFSLNAPEYKATINLKQK
jgi:uncharacterized protein (DUF2141 family)